MWRVALPARKKVHDGALPLGTSWLRMRLNLYDKHGYINNVCILHIGQLFLLRRAVESHELCSTEPFWKRSYYYFTVEYHFLHVERFILYVNF